MREGISRLTCPFPVWFVCKRLAPAAAGQRRAVSPTNGLGSRPDLAREG